jgi:hypothetical protein
MEEGDATDLPTVNRFAVLLVPTEAFLRWAMSCPGGETETSLDSVRREPTAYLIPEGDAEPEQYVQRYYKRMLIEELTGWVTDETSWPDDRSYQTFCSFFEVHVTSMVFDLATEPLERDA